MSDAAKPKYVPWGEENIPRLLDKIEPLVTPQRWRGLLDGYLPPTKMGRSDDE